MSEALKDRIVAGLMVSAFALHLVPTDFFFVSAEYEAMRQVQDRRMWVGPGYSLLVSVVLTLFLPLIGGLTRIFGWKHSRKVLVVATIAYLLSFAGYEAYAETNLSAAVGVVWVLLLGWLLAVPVPQLHPDNATQDRMYTWIVALLALSICVFTVWSHF